MVKTEPFSEKASPKIKTHWVHIEPDNQLIEDTDFLRKQMKEFPGRYKHLIEVLKKEEVMKEIETLHGRLTRKILEVRDENRTKWEGREDSGIITGLVLAQDELNELKKRLE